MEYTAQEIINDARSDYTNLTVASEETAKEIYGSKYKIYIDEIHRIKERR